MVTKTKKVSKEKKPVKEAPAEESAEKKSRARTAPKSGRTAVEIWNELFTKNFRAKLTDDELQAAYEEEMGRPLGQPVSRLRSYFNNGKYGLGEGEDVKLQGDDRSVAYDEKGEKMKSRRGRPTKDADEDEPKFKKAKAKSKAVEDEEEEDEDEDEEDEEEEEEEEVPRKRRTRS